MDFGEDLVGARNLLAGCKKYQSSWQTFRTLEILVFIRLRIDILTRFGIKYYLSSDIMEPQLYKWFDLIQFFN